MDGVGDITAFLTKLGLEQRVQAVEAPAVVPRTPAGGGGEGGGGEGGDEDDGGEGRRPAV